MELWFLICISLCTAAIVKSLVSLLFAARKPLNLPPGPHTIPIISNLQWLGKTSFELEPILKSLHVKLGPVVTLFMGNSPVIFIADPKIAHQALVENGSIFADRPPARGTIKLISSNQHNINTASYGPTWRALRRNLTANILHPNRVKSYTRARNWALEILMNELKSDHGIVLVHEHFQYAMFCLLVFMCFGDRLEENQIKEIEKVQRAMLVNLSKFEILNFWPSLTKIVLRKKWKEFRQLRRNQEEILIPLIRARKKIVESETKTNDEKILSYVDTLLNLELPEENRKLTEDEMVSLCSEFLNAGTDTTSTALQWIMANIVKYPIIQEKLFDELKGVMKKGENLVKEEYLENMSFLKAVILEGLRRHPPVHYVAPHSVVEDTEFGGYWVPKDAVIQFMVAEMGWDPKIWEDSMRFNPERFLGKDQVFDITGSRDIKMMPFGAGRRICPAYGLAMLHLQYFVANLVWNFKWSTPANGEDVNLEEKLEFTVVMKHPLKAVITSRF
ncbi:hypothetical protein ACFE04_000893 [Oxalis oulophora]